MSAERCWRGDDLDVIGGSSAGKGRGVEARLAGLLVGGLTTVDEFAACLDLPVATILGAITLLELRGLVVSAYGRYRPAGSLASSPPGLPRLVCRVPDPVLP